MKITIKSGTLMFFCRQILLLLFYVVTVSCEKSATISQESAKYVPSEHITLIDARDIIPIEVTNLLSAGKAANQKQYKFPLAYYLIQEEDAKFSFSKNFDPKIASQLVMIISGMKYYKLFVHPDSELQYSFLKHAYRYISPEETEFFATPTPERLTVAVWTKRNLNRKPFMVKMELDEKTMGELNSRIPAEILSESKEPELMKMVFQRKIRKSKGVIEGQEITAIPSK